MTVTHFLRRNNGHAHSIDRVFAPVRAAFPPEWKCRQAVCRYPSQGLIKRLYNLAEANFRQGDVNHLTGDIHYLGFFLRKARTVLTVHDCGAMLRLRGWRRLLFRWLWLALPVRRSAVVTVVSEQTKEELVKYTRCAAGKIRVVPNPVGPEFTPVCKTFNTVKPVILQVGTAVNKNVRRVATAVAGLSCEFHIVGPLSDRDRRFIEELAIEYRSSERLTNEEIVRAYQDADIVVFASVYEGFGMPIVEAQAIGRAVITSGIPPMCDVAGEGACLVNPLDPASIRTAVLQIVNDRQYREALIQAGYENAKRYSAAVVAREYLGIYQELLRCTGNRCDGASITDTRLGRTAQSFQDPVG
jgi:glycosyltransferase involved in cell wall biosynthesis